MAVTATPPRGPAGPDAGAGADTVLDARARLLAERRSERDTPRESYLLAAAAGTKVALSTARARNVVPMRPLARLPGSGAGIVGLAAVHGGLVPVADLSLLITGAASGTAADGQLLLIDDRGSRLGLRVERVEGLVTLESVPSGDRPTGTPGIVRHVATGGVLVLDVDALLADPRLWPPGGTAVDTNTSERDGALPR